MTQEDALIKQWVQGDSAALDGLIEQLYPEILRYCLWHAPNRSLAEEAAQETFLKALRALVRYAPRGKFKAFLYQIAANTCTDMWRKRWLTDSSLEETEVTYAETAFEQIQSDAAFRQMVDSLPAEQRELVLLRYGQDLTMREIAAIVDLPLRTVQSRLRAALNQLKKDVTRGGI